MKNVFNEARLQLMNINFEAAIFDLDGTLIDSMWIWEKIIFEFLDKYNCKYNSNIAEEISYMTFELSSAYIKKLYGLPQSCEEIMSEWISMSENYYKNIIEPKKGAKEYLKLLKSKGIKIALATACPRYLCEAVLKANDMEKYFDVIVYAEEVGKSKEEPDVYIETLHRLGITADKCMLYEDILVALYTARRIGLAITIVEDKASIGDKDKLILKSDFYITDFTEVL